MELSTPDTALRARQYDAERHQAAYETKDMSAIDIVRLGRQNLATQRTIPAIKMSLRFSPRDAEALREAVAPKLETCYDWFKSIDSATLSRVMNMVTTFRRDYLTTHGTTPSDARIYAEFRLRSDVEPGGVYSASTPAILEALMGGNITRGSLPPLPYHHESIESSVSPEIDVTI